MSNPDNICGDELNQEVYMKVIWIIYEILTVSAGVYLSYKWYQYRNTFPLMERSPYLSLYFLVNVMIYLLSYPVFLQSSFLKSKEDSLLLKCLFIPFQGSYTYIYLMKSWRLSWGFYIKREGILKKLESKINYCFAREPILLLFCLGFLLFNILTGILPSPDYNQIDFMVINIKDNDTQILLARMIENYFGVTYLFLSLWCVRRVDKRVNIIYELYLIIVCDLITASVRHILMMAHKDLASNLCINDSIPLLYVINWIKLTTTLWVGMVRPLKMINREHKYYNSILVKRLEFFLFYQPEIFPKFIEYCKAKSEEISIRSNPLIRAHSQNSHNQGQPSSPLLQNSPIHSAQPLQEVNNHLNQSPTFQLNNHNQQHSSSNNNNDNSHNFHNQNNCSSQESSLFNPSQVIQSSRELFLRKFQYQQVKGYLNIFLKSLEQHNSCKFEEEFKTFIQNLRITGQFEGLFGENTELMQHICYWLNIDSFTSGINRAVVSNQNVETLSSSCLGVLGTLYHNNQQQLSVSSSQEEYFTRRQIESSQIIDSIFKYCEQMLQPTFNEYKMTHSYQQIQQEIKNQQQAYTNLLIIKMAVDQDISLQ